MGSRFSVKFLGNKVVLFACDVFNDIDVNPSPSLTAQQALNAATEGVQESITFMEVQPQMAILPLPVEFKNEFRLVYEVMVKTMSTTHVPSHYNTLVDAHSGEILYRQNMVAHHNHSKCQQDKGKPKEPSNAVSVVNASVSGTVYPFHPYQTQETQGLPNIYITVAGEDYEMDENGGGTLPVAPGSSGQVRMMGPWSRVYSNGVTPSMNVTLQDGNNTISFDSNSNVKERCAYKGVNEIHDHMKFWMPDFDGMDYQLTTNVDEEGECNAFYDGASINFYDAGGGCNATSLIADVIYHEYGHGINDFFYNSLGANFTNGAMGEGYADFWGVSATNNPNLGIGFYDTNEDPLREYDAAPMVYPDNLIGQVHNDGEIIMGAWWDTHLLMGADWNVTMPLFVEAYAGLQAATFNGNEGEAFTDVLIDALQADDNDGDLSNGTPNGNAIVEGFYIHGITLISNATLSHNDDEFIDANQPLPVIAELDLDFPYTQYLQDVKCYYRINDGAWNITDMVDEGNDEYSFEIDPQPAGTVIAYCFALTDLNQSIGGVLPIEALIEPFPNLPYYTLCGVEVIKVHDGDDFNQFGSWQTGLGTDNATTGEWEQDDPIGSYTVDASPGTEVQVENQHTPGGEICFFTGNGTSVDAGIGENDVDGGKTTLQSPIIDMTTYEDPIIAYWRYYTNSPPGGANPGQDYWQVRMTNNNGNSWTYIENSKTGDMSWRRNAFRVSDYLEPTAQMRFQFIASDSTIIGQNLDGGSLIEGAVDDFVLYDSYAVGVDETDAATSLIIYPNPASNEVTVSCADGQTIQSVSLTNATGQLIVMEQKNMRILNSHARTLDISSLATGIYTVTITTDQSTVSSSFVKK